MTSENRRKRKVVEGSQVFFEEDITLREDALPAPLLLPPLEPALFDELVLLYRDCFYHLVEEGDGPDRMTLDGLSFPVVPWQEVQAVEKEYLQTHADAVTRARAEFLRSLHPSLVDAAGNAVRTEPARQAASVALDKLRLLAAPEPARPAKALLPLDHLKPATSPSVLIAARPSYERTLFLDGRCYDLLTTAEFFEAWKKGFHPELARDVLNRPTPWPARELADFLLKNAGRANPRALSVVCANLYTRHRPLTLTLDGQDLVIVPRDATSTLLADWLKALAVEIKRQALAQFLTP
jgi:hypothetical protein